VRVLFALSGLHRVDRGAEIAFIQIASRLAEAGDEVTLIGSGADRPGAPYRFLHAPALPRERFEQFPKIPTLRSDTGWEEATFAPGLLKAFRPSDFDITVTCGYPWTNWALRRPGFGAKRPLHVFVTQNGDWPARAGNSEYRLFDCDGLVCTNPDYYAANKDRYRCALIPNGVDLDRFKPGAGDRSAFDLPQDVPIVLMVSALIDSKFVDVGIEAIARLPEVHLAVAGDGPRRDAIHSKAQALMPGRFHNFTVSADRMPSLYRSANAFMHLSRDESFGNVFVEAMACGTPTIAWDLERTRWITGDTAFLVEGTGSQALSEAVSTAIDNPPPIARLVERAQGFSWSSIALAYRNFFDELVRDGR